MVSNASWPRTIFAAGVFILGSVVVSAAAPDTGYERGALVYSGGTVVLVGSQERRVVFGGALRASRFDRRLTLDRLPGRIVYETSYTYSNGSRKGRPRNTYHGLGATVLARYEFPYHGGMRIYSEVGWGLFLTSRISTDVNNPVNSTPVAGVGLVIPSRGDEFSIGVRFWHISNAGTNLPNKGQNQLLLVAGWRW